MKRTSRAIYSRTTTLVFGSGLAQNGGYSLLILMYSSKVAYQIFCLCRNEFDFLTGCSYGSILSVKMTIIHLKVMKKPSKK